MINEWLMINEYGRTWKIWPSPLSLSLYSTFKETRDSRYIYQNKSGKACFQHDMAYGDFKGLSRRTASDEVLHDKAFNVAKNSNYDRYQCRLASVVYKYFDKKSTAANGCK